MTHLLVVEGLGKYKQQQSQYQQKNNTIQKIYVTKIEKQLYGSSSSSCRAARRDIPDPLSPLFPIVHRLRQVFWATSHIFT